MPFCAVCLPPGAIVHKKSCGCDQPVWCFHTTKNEWMLWYVYVHNLNEFNPWLMLVILYVCVCRSMHKLTQLERLDLGSNEFTEVVSSTCLSFSCRMHYCSLCLPSSSQCSQVSNVLAVNADALIESFFVRLHLICIFL